MQALYDHDIARVRGVLVSRPSHISVDFKRARYVNAPAERPLDVALNWATDGMGNHANADGAVAASLLIEAKANVDALPLLSGEYAGNTKGAARATFKHRFGELVWCLVALM